MKDSRLLLAPVLSLAHAAVIALSFAGGGRATANDLAIASMPADQAENQRTLSAAVDQWMLVPIGPVPLFELDPTADPGGLGTGPVADQGAVTSDNTPPADALEAAPAEADSAASSPTGDTGECYRYEYPEENRDDGAESADEADFAGEDCPESGVRQDACPETEDTSQYRYMDDCEIGRDATQTYDLFGESRGPRWTYDEEWESDYSDYAYEDEWANDEVQVAGEEDAALEEADEYEAAYDDEQWDYDYGEYVKEESEPVGEPEDIADDAALEDGDEAQFGDGEEWDSHESDYEYEYEDEWAKDESQAVGEEDAALDEADEYEAAYDDGQWEYDYGDYAEEEFEPIDQPEDIADDAALEDGEQAQLGDGEEWHSDESDYEYDYEDEWAKDEFQVVGEEDAALDEADEYEAAYDDERWEYDYGDYGEEEFEPIGEPEDIAGDAQLGDGDEAQLGASEEWDSDESDYEYDYEDEWMKDAFQMVGEEDAATEEGEQYEPMYDDEQWEYDYGDYVEKEFEPVGEPEDFAEEAAVEEHVDAERTDDGGPSLDGYRGYSDAYPYEEFAYPEGESEPASQASVPGGSFAEDSFYGRGEDPSSEDVDTETLSVDSQSLPTDTAVEGASKAGSAGRRVVGAIRSVAFRSLSTLSGAVRNATLKLADLDWGTLPGAAADQAASHVRASEDAIQR